MALNLRGKARSRAASIPDTDEKSRGKPADSRSAPLSVQPQEPADAYLTGGSRSLQRRLLGLNIEGGAAKKHPASPPGQHATGSFVEVKSDDTPKSKR
ncbi:MAG TPA: hypothetical protein VHT28_09420 [Silvibacterium sp.]|jgi:hypothetical protein|nr:hypothetical protein [Silvibacterium sp.]